MDVHRAARIMSAAHGGQILVSEATRALISHALPEDATLRDLGEHRLKDMPAPERLYQVVARGLAADFPAPNSLDAIPNNLPISASVLVGRAEELAQLRRILEGETARLCTLTGPGGIGKTRLAVAAASNAARALHRRRHLCRSRARARGHDRPCRDRARDEPRRSRRSRPPNSRRRAPAAATVCS